MKMILVILSLMFSTIAFGQSKADMKKMLDQFKAQGMFSEAQLAEAQKQLDAMDEEELDAIKAKAQEKLNDPEMMKQVQELKRKQEEASK